MDISSPQWYIVFAFIFSGMMFMAGMPIPLTLAAFYASAQLVATPIYWWAVWASYALLVAPAVLVRVSRGR